MTSVEKNISRLTKHRNLTTIVFSLCKWYLCYLFTGYGYYGPFLEWWGGYHKPENIQIWIKELLVPVLDLKPSMLIPLHTSLRNQALLLIYLTVDPKN